MAKKQLLTPEPIPTPAGYTVLARRYRPQQFADLVGQEGVAQALTNAITSNRIAHAYLFTGTRGVGKTSTARILAKALNCESGPTPTPCDACDSCRAIAAGEDIDVLEIDGASNNKVEEVREIRQNVQYLPSRSRFKIYIIDEVHMLSTAAFNALLKTLEEPPAHVKFLFATTEAQKIPVTILSRCQRFDLGGIGTESIRARLRDIVEREGISADDEALEILARRANGSMRDAQSLLDQLLAFGGDRLGVDQVNELLGTASDEVVQELAAAVLGKDVPRALAILGTAVDSGAALGELTDQLIGYWRDLMMVSCASADAKNIGVSGRHRQTLERQAKALSLDSILAGLDILSATKARFRGSNHGRVLLEMAVVRLSRLDDLVSLSQLSQIVARGPGPAPASAAALTAKSVELSDGSAKKNVSVAPGQVTAERVALTESTLPTIWQQVVSRLGPMTATQLQGSGLPAISGPNSLVMRLPSSYNQYSEGRQGNTKLVSRVEEELLRATGQEWFLRLEALPADSTGIVRDPVAAQEVPRRVDRRAEAMKSPVLKRLIDVLDAQLQHLDDDFSDRGPAGQQPGLTRVD